MKCLCFRFVTIYRGPSHTYKVQRLNESSSYCLRIQAVSEAGEGLFSEVHTFHTTKSVPPALKGKVYLYRNMCSCTGWTLIWCLYSYICVLSFSSQSGTDGRECVWGELGEHSTNERRPHHLHPTGAGGPGVWLQTGEIPCFIPELSVM